MQIHINRYQKICRRKDSKLRKEKVIISHRFLLRQLFQRRENVILVVLTLTQCHMAKRTPVTKTTSPQQYLKCEIKHTPRINVLVVLKYKTENCSSFLTKMS